jgi:hypothetical protein
MGLNHVAVITYDVLKITSFLKEDLEEVNLNLSFRRCGHFPLYSLK